MDQIQSESTKMMQKKDSPKSEAVLE